MQLGEILIARGLVSAANMHSVNERQRRSGGKLDNILVDMNLLSQDQLAGVLASIESVTPAMPRDLLSTGVSPGLVMNLMLRLMHLEVRETVSELALSMCLPYKIVRGLMDEAGQRKLVQALGSIGAGTMADIRYTLSEAGIAAAKDAAVQCLYLGPAPVSLAAYQDQVRKQSITNEPLTAERLRRGLADLVAPEHYIRKLLPAINAGRSILLFGPAGNGKTTFATRIADLFQDVVYIPYAVEIDGHIMRVFDPGLHHPAVSETDKAKLGASRLGAPDYDDRWVACYRPFAMAGGELTMDMLELQLDHQSNTYDAPLHVKALNGVFLIDDFGRQQMNPKDLLNRWIVPMENRIDFLKLKSGKTFSLPFDDLLIFSTNIEPQNIMDPALLRRIPYKIKLYAPTKTEYIDLFRREAMACDLVVSPDILDFIIRVLSGPAQFGLAYFQPRFICEQVSQSCRAFQMEKRMTKELAIEALSNLYVQIENERDNDLT
jgi:predicted ATPase with chaperone activity